jgi:hypothetical protein
MTSTIEWVASTAELPDADETVILALEDGDVTTGFLDGDTWRAWRVAIRLPDAPLFWARFPEPPQPRAKKGKKK